MTRKRLLIVLALAVLIAAGAILAVLLVKQRAARDVQGSSTEEFVTTDAPQPKPPPLPGVEWPMYGFAATRDRVSPYQYRPPFRQVWKFRGRSLLEFPPVVAYGRLFVANNDGVLFAVDVRTGREAWRYDSGRVQAASPAVAANVVIHTFLYRRGAKSRQNGEVIAFAAATGKILWRHILAGPSESSPLVLGTRVYVGDWSGRISCFDVATGALRWTARAGGEVKGALSGAGGTIYVGSYDHHVYAFDANSGAQRWRTSVQSRLGSAGRFYSSPALAYGRVYIGATDGRIYSYGATSGVLRWSHRTGGYIYASPAVWQKRVFVGSYDRHFYALDAATGEVLWRFDAGGRISGSATVVSGLVYFSTLEGRTFALDARTGARAWSFPDGAYTPVIADRQHLYLVGKATVRALVSRAQPDR
jgi:outer membrane protein assembly factor BamB